MEPQTETNNQFKPLDCDDDILLIQKDTFTVGRFKEIASQKLHTRFYSVQGLETMGNIHSHLSLGTLNIPIEDSKLIFPIQGIDCQILKIGSQGWLKGRLRMEVYLCRNKGAEINLILEFCPNESTSSESVLDEIRQSEEYKRLTNPN